MAAENEKSRLDDAARAGWLYFIAGHTQDEIAKMLQVSRASAQRLVSLCLAERLITFRLEHPIAACMELAARLKERFDLAHCEVVPSDLAAPQATAGIAERCANLLDATLRSETPVIVALGTGRAVRAAVERVTPIDRPNHQIVSLVGNISADGSASFYDTVGRLADRTGARHYPMPLPFLMSSEDERNKMVRIEPIAKVKAIGEITGWAYDAKGRLLKAGTNKRLTSIPPEVPAKTTTIGAAVGGAKVPAIAAALNGRLINGLITDEATARAILER